MLSVTERALAIVVVLLSTWMVRMLVSPETTLAGVKDLFTRNWAFAGLDKKAMHNANKNEPRKRAAHILLLICKCKPAPTV